MELFKTITRKIEGIITYASDIRGVGATTIAELATSVITDVADLRAITLRQEGMLEEARRVYELTIGHHTLMLPPAFTDYIRSSTGPPGVSDNREAPTPAPRRSVTKSGKEPATAWDDSQRVDKSAGQSEGRTFAPSSGLVTYSSDDLESDYDTDPEQQLALTRRSSRHSDTTVELEESGLHGANSISDGITSPVAGPSTLRVDSGDRVITTGCMRAAALSSIAGQSTGNVFTHQRTLETPRFTSSRVDATPVNAGPNDTPTTQTAETLQKGKGKIYREYNLLTSNQNRYVYLFDVPAQYIRGDLASMALGSIGTGGYFRPDRQISKGTVTADWTCELDARTFRILHGNIRLAGKLYRIRIKDNYKIPASYHNHRACLRCGDSSHTVKQCPKPKAKKKSNDHRLHSGTVRNTSSTEPKSVQPAVLPHK